eukprot:10661732-Lingulodinium_polyedra.AAC.1
MYNRSTQVLRPGRWVCKAVLGNGLAVTGRRAPRPTMGRHCPERAPPAYLQWALGSGGAPKRATAS